MAEDANQPTIIMPAKPQRRMSIKGLIPSLPERGKVKIGMLGEKRRSQGGNEYQRPVRLDHFRVTTMERGTDGNFVRDEEIHKRIGDKPTEIPVRLLYDDVDLNCPTRYAAYNGRTLWCAGDGEFASRLMQDGKHKQIECPCHLSDPSYAPQKGDPPKCKMNASLSMIVDGASGLGGVWKLRTTGYNTIMSLLGTMQFLASVTGGPLANIPLKLRVQPKQATNPVDGTPVTIQYVSLEFAGDMTTLQQLGHQIALDRATTHVSIQEIETEARRRLALAAPINAPLPGDETEDVVAEFYPEQYDDVPPPPPPTRAQFRGDGRPLNSMSHPENVPVPEDADMREAATGDIDPAATETAEVEISGSVNDGYVVSLSDGTETNLLDARTTVQVMIAEIRARAKHAGLDGLSAAIYDNRHVYEVLEKDGHADLAMEIRTEGMLIMDEVQEKMRTAKASGGIVDLRKRVQVDAGDMEGATAYDEKGNKLVLVKNPAHPEPARASMVVPPNTDGPPLSAGTPPVLPSERANLSVQNQDRGYQSLGSASEGVERRDAQPGSTSGGIPVSSTTSESRQPLHPDTSEPRSIDCKTIAIHVGLGGDRGDLTRGKDWKRTTPEVIKLVKTLTKDEHQRFRGENKKFLEDMSVAWKEGWNQVKEAFDARGQELGP